MINLLNNFREGKMKSRHSIHQSFFLFTALFVLLITGCSFMGQAESSEIQKVTVEVTREVIKEVTVEITREITSLVVETVEVPVTVTPSATPRFTATITQTPTITLTPTETPTITPTITQTKAPGIGAELRCSDVFIVKVVEEPRKETKFYRETAQGEFWLLKIEITNLMNQNFDLNDDDFVIQAELNGQKAEFISNWDITFDWVYHHWGQLIYPHDDLVAGLTATVGIGFDVNPNAENFKLVWFPRDNMFDDRDEALCEVIIPLE
jgi:hypothetical protein